MSFSGCPTGQELLARAEQHGDDDALDRHVHECAVCAAAFACSAEEARRQVSGVGSAQLSPFWDEPQCHNVVDHLLASPALILAAEDPMGRTTPHLKKAESRGVRSLAGYELLDQVGEGGMGTVYRAHHRLLGKDRAMKIVHKGSLGSADAEARFLREIRTGGQLEHPNIVSVIDAGEEQGELFLVMELLDGCDAGAMVRARGPLPIAEACEIIRQSAVGLQYAHEKGYIHRDIKPSNLFVTSSGVVKILDLGLARLREAGPAEEARTQGILGTPTYMAPEQFQDSHSVDVRADLYSLGCTLFHLLSGRPPFIGRESPLVCMKQHCESTPAPLASLRPEVPAELEAIVGRLLEKDPAKRFQTAEEVAVALAPFTQGAQPGSLAEKSRASGLPRNRSSARIGRLWWLAGAGVVLFAALGLLWWNWPGPVAKEDGPLRVKTFQVERFTEQGEESRLVDVLSTNPTQGKGQARTPLPFEALVRVRVEFSEPAYAYLIEFNPKGGEPQLHWPVADHKKDMPPDPLAAPPRVASVCCPPEKAVGPTGKPLTLRLDDEPRGGLQAFAVVLSRRPLPAFSEWLATRKVSWQRQEGKGAWLANREGIFPVVPERGVLRSSRVELKGPDLLPLVQGLNADEKDVEVEVLAFPVAAREEKP